MTTLAVPLNYETDTAPATAAAKTQPIAPDPMRYQLQAGTGAGRALVSIAESLAGVLAERAAEHDREASYPFEAIEALKEHNYFAAPIPEQFGGLGVGSARDILIASSRMARGDASVIIGVNMHLAAVMSIVRRWNIAQATGNERRMAAFGGTMQMIASNGVVMAAAVSEPAQDLTRPSARAVRTEGGWLLNGKKIFCTMSPAANFLYAAVTFVHDDGQELYGYAQFPKNMPGVTVHNDWDALGMRASGSHSVSFEDVHLPAAALRGGFPAGHLTIDFMERNLAAGAFHASASVGIAESAHALAVQSLAARRKGPDETPRNQMLAAENAMDISAIRAMFDRAGRVIDDYYAGHPADDGTFEEMTAAFAEIQSAKTFINEAAVRVVDRALALSGGAGYMNKHPLSRAYRDARAGAFMHPLGANRAYEFIAQVTLGLEPNLS